MMINSVDKRIKEEKRTVEVMVRIYCHGQHGSRSLCRECQELMDYAFARLEKCPQASAKPTCSKCTIHCYRPDMRVSIRNVMKYSGPRMLIHHPMMAIKHLLRSMKN